MSTINLKAAALDYAARGWAVFPLVPGDKVPLIAARDGGRGCLDATTDTAAIEAWWRKTPGANVGIATGKVSGVMVIDLDKKDDGPANFEDLKRQRGEVTHSVAALVAQTGNGWHLYFRHAPGIRCSVGKNGGIAPGIDVRSDGGFVVAPPSLHPSGRRYRWVRDHGPSAVPVSAAPDWLIDAARNAPGTATDNPVASPERHRDLFAAGVAEGGRNAAVAQLAGYFLRKYVDPLLTLDLLRLWNAHRCRPPVDDDELVRTVASICKRELARRTPS